VRRESSLPWARDEALDLYRELERESNEAGWLLAMYGSVLTAEEGRDLDLIAVARRPSASTQWLRSAVERRLGPVDEVDRYRSVVDGSLAVCWRSKSGRIIDVKFVAGDPQVDYALRQP
jgi:hypothetical protein